MTSETYVFPPRKAEIANVITHAIGVIFSVCVIGLVFFSSVIPFVQRDAVSVFAFSMLAMYTASTIYHWVVQPELKTVLRLFDHIAIYFLIAGTYTPFIIFCLSGILKYVLMCVIWGIVVLGIVYKLVWWKRFPSLSLYIYLAMGWMVVFIIKPVYNTLSVQGFVWLIAGGLCYSLGTVFYAQRKPVYNHAIWHLFVLAGSSCHFMAILSL